MTTENTNTNTTTEKKVFPQMKTLEGWADRVADLNKFISEMGELTTENFVNNGVRKAGKAQALGVLLHCSSGYVGDKFRGKTTTEELVAVVAELIAPDLTPEQVKERNKNTARNALKNLRDNGVPEEVIITVISAMPEGKAVLAEK